MINSPQLMAFSFLPKKNVQFIKNKMQFSVCFLKMFRPLKGWYIQTPGQTSKRKYKIYFFGVFLSADFWQKLSWCFLFYQKKKCNLLKKNAIFCLFLKNVSPSKRLVCFVLNNVHFPMVEDLAFHAHKSLGSYPRSVSKNEKYLFGDFLSADFWREL